MDPVRALVFSQQSSFCTQSVHANAGQLRDFSVLFLWSHKVSCVK